MSLIASTKFQSTHDGNLDQRMLVARFLSKHQEAVSRKVYAIVRHLRHMRTMSNFWRTIVRPYAYFLTPAGVAGNVCVCCVCVWGGGEGRIFPVISRQDRTDFNVLSNGLGPAVGRKN